MPSPSNDVNDDVEDNVNEVPNDPKPTSQKPFTPPLHFLKTTVKDKLDLRFGKFLEVLKKLHINILFIDALCQVSSMLSF